MDSIEILLRWLDNKASCFVFLQRKIRKRYDSREFCCRDIVEGRKDSFEYRALFSSPSSIPRLKWRRAVHSTRVAAEFIKRSLKTSGRRTSCSTGFQRNAILGFWIPWFYLWVEDNINAIFRILEFCEKKVSINWIEEKLGLLQFFW